MNGADPRLQQTIDGIVANRLGEISCLAGHVPLHYLARNPGLAVSAVEESISDHGTSSVVYPTSKLGERPNDKFAAGHFTSACSPTIHGGDAYCCEPVHNLVHRDVLVATGSSFIARRAYENAEFLSSTDTWCRPVNLCSGPDGALYVVDMYRAVIEHPQWIPLEMQKRVAAGYREVIAELSASERIVTIDGTQALDDVTAAMVRAVEEVL